MTHLYIEQNGITEEVTSSVISKLYEIVTSGTLDGASDLKGRLHSSSGYQDEIQYLNNNFDELYISADIYYIRFEDTVVENICLQNFSSDGEGCSTSDLANVTSLGDIFKDGSNIVNFDEFKYFTGINWISNQFNDNTTLQKITIPSSVTNIGIGTSITHLTYGGGFNGCTNLKQVTFLGDARIGSATFKNCTNLQTVVLNGKLFISEDGQDIFYQCVSLTDLDFTKIDKLCSGLLANCTGFQKNITIPNNVEYIGNSCFAGSEIQSIQFEQGGSTPLVLEGADSGYRPGVFKALPQQTIYFPERLSELSTNALGNTSKINFVFASTTPPTVTGDLGYVDESWLYVPDSAVATYQAATGFSTYSSRIKSVNELSS